MKIVRLVSRVATYDPKYGAMASASMCAEALPHDSSLSDVMFQTACPETTTTTWPTRALFEELLAHTAFQILLMLAVR